MKINLPNIALLKRSLMLESRSIVTYGYRFCLLIAILFCLIVFHENSRSFRFAAAGLYFFSWITYINLAFITLAGFSLFASAITEEKEDKTMTLLLMTGIRPFTMLLSKVGSRFFAGAALLIAQIPFTMFAITLGGVSTKQIFAVFIALFAYLVFLCGLAILMSTISRNSQKASIFTFLSLLLFYTLHFIINIVCCSFMSIVLGVKDVWRSDEFVFWDWTYTSPFRQVMRVCSTAFSGSYEVVFGIQFWSNIIAGICCFCLAWLFFNRCNRTENNSEKAPWFISSWKKRLKILAPARVWTWVPLLWKEFYFSTGGFLSMIIKSVVYLGIGLLLVYVPDHRYRPYRSMGESIIVSGLYAIGIEITYYASTLFSKERKSRTWSSLYMLPFPTLSLAYKRIIGVTPAFIPLALYILVGYSFSWDYFERETIELFSHSMAWAVGLYFIFYFHLTTFLSLFIKYGSWAISGIIAFLLFISSAYICFEIFRARSENSFAFFITTIALSATVFLHFQIIRKLERLAASD